ncbi:MAG: A/G-specific adenine glycosylase [Crocinitomicaceae bacterium]|nr:A/G-specific adenine glycosylase [Crocinitomicaceae bacterium]
MDISSGLINWYRKSYRELPWRNTRDPYKIWLSEVILQQTRVAQGVGYYYRLTELFPDVKALAAASEDQLLRAWQGLGYYSRARNLHIAAREVVNRFNGRFPDNYYDLLQLKGVGPYTAAAIASFCFDEKRVVVDGNVLRVISRIFGVEAPVDQPSGKKKIEKIAGELVPGNTPGLFNQAIMEFGALVCTPQKPACDECPFTIECIARQKDLVEVLPVKVKKTVVKNVWMYYLVLKNGSDVFIRKRSHSSIWKGLYDFPSVDSEYRQDISKVFPAFAEKYGLPTGVFIEKISSEFVHILSHRKIYACFIEADPGKNWKKMEGLTKVRLSDLGQYGIPRLIERYLETREA